MTALWVAWLGIAGAETADEVVSRAQQANQVSSSVQAVTMTNVSKGGSKQTRNLELKSRRSEGRVATYLHVLTPADQAGTKMLMIDHAEKADEQMVYLPAFKRTNRISGSSRKGSFVGSTFSYEDLDIREAAEGEHAMFEERDDAWVIDTVPADSPQYSKVRSEISKADLVARRITFFDKKGREFKVLTVQETKQLGEVTLAVRTVMRNVLRGTSTELLVTDVKLDLSQAELPEDTFTQTYLER